jgi:hypothetical protein
MKRVYLIAASIGAAGIGVVLGVSAILPEAGVTKARYDRVALGMTLKEVEDVFEMPATKVFEDVSHDMRIRSWRNHDGSGAGVFFGTGDTVTDKWWRDSTETTGEKLRRDSVALVVGGVRRSLTGSSGIFRRKNPAQCDWWIACLVVLASLVPIGIAYEVATRAVPPVPGLVGAVGGLLLWMSTAWGFRFRVPLNSIEEVMLTRGFRPVVGVGLAWSLDMVHERTMSLAGVDLPTGQDGVPP